MTETFQKALLWHLSEHKTRMTDLSRSAGVSLDVLKKLKTRPVASTKAETAAKIATYYGKSVAEFMRCQTIDAADDEIEPLIALLTDEERQYLVRQVRWILSQRD